MLSDVQKVLLQLLKELDEICKSNGITYYLVGGSALGAIRNRGFLPWDDDADIVLDHPNYMRFIDVMQNIDLPPNRTYSDPFLEPYTHTNVFGRYSAADTTCIFDGIAYQKDNQAGIKVDVFHLLPCPNPGKARDEYLNRFRMWAELCHPTARNRETDADAYWNLCQEATKIGLGNLRRRLFLELAIDSFDDGDQYLYAYERRHIFYDRAVFKQPKYVEFEDTFLPVPTLFQEHFRILFGDDWFIIPDVAERVTHKTCTDTERASSFYTYDYLAYEEPNDFHLRQRYKYSVLKYWEAQKEVDIGNGRLQGALLEKK